MIRLLPLQAGIRSLGRNMGSRLMVLLSIVSWKVLGGRSGGKHYYYGTMWKHWTSTPVEMGVEQNYLSPMHLTVKKAAASRLVTKCCMTG